MDSRVVIGKVTEVSNSSIGVTIDKSINSPYLIFDANPVRVGGVGSFIKIENDIFEIVNEKMLIDSTRKDRYVKAECNRVIICNLIGFFKNGEFFQGSSGNTPNIFDNVYNVLHNELIKIYSGTTEMKSIFVGKYLNDENLDFHIDIDKFFASHLLIVGNTGSGKSNTVNTIFTELFLKYNTNQSYFLIIDTNGEYSKAFTTKKNTLYLNTRKVVDNAIKIPIELLDIEDWKLLLEATEKTQYPIIKSTWNAVTKNIFDKGNSVDISSFILGKLKDTIAGILNSNSNPSNKLAAIMNIKDDIRFYNGKFYRELERIFDIFDDIVVNGTRLTRGIWEDSTKSIIAEINQITITAIQSEFGISDYGFILNLEHIYRTYKYSMNENNTSPLIARFNSNKRSFEKIFTPYTNGTPADILDVFYKEKSIVVCDVSSANKDIRRIIVTFVCSKLYNYFCHNKGEKTSLHLIVDEAHNYLSSQKIEKEDAIAKTCIETFESIIKEGRKFGVFLTMATQRPSDITSTLLSQAHNYVIHKLVNPKDIDIIKNTVPFIDDMSMKMLNILAPGQAIFSGTAFNRPNIVQIKRDEEITKVESDTVKLSDSWNLITLDKCSIENEI